MNITKKLTQVKRILKKYPGVIVAFSGGVDSTVLLKIAKEVLNEHVVAVTAVSPLHPKSEIRQAKKIAKLLESTHIILQSNELNNTNFTSNQRNRCYICKLGLFKELKRIAHKYGYTVIEASNKSDLLDCRPGLRALRKLNIVSPFIRTDIDKKTIRILARKFGLPNWDKPSAACLISRIPYGRKIDRKILQRIEGAEDYLKRLPLSQIRVRDHFPLARIEVSLDEFNIILKEQKKLVKYFKKLGYTYIALDLEGYQTGSLNR